MKKIKRYKYELLAYLVLIVIQALFGGHYMQVVAVAMIYFVITKMPFYKENQAKTGGEIPPSDPDDPA